jgi:GNAT superfamily N-acetyltransferase
MVHWILNNACRPEPQQYNSNAEILGKKKHGQYKGLLMNIEGKIILQQGHWEDYLRFRPLCCVESLPYPRGHCWTAGIMAADESHWIDPDAAFIGYNWPYRFNSVRNRAITELQDMPERSRMTFINRHVRTLSRIMVRPAHRGRGIASWLLAETINLVPARYIECLTFTQAIARILRRQGFIDYGITGGMACNYYLWQAG